MKLPYWVEEDIKMLPAGFTGHVVIEIYRGGVSRIETKTSRQAPQPVPSETVRHVFSS